MLLCEGDLFLGPESQIPDPRSVLHHCSASTPIAISSLPITNVSRSPLTDAPGPARKNPVPPSPSPKARSGPSAPSQRNGPLRRTGPTPVPFPTPSPFPGLARSLRPPSGARMCSRVGVLSIFRWRRGWVRSWDNWDRDRWDRSGCLLWMGLGRGRGLHREQVSRTCQRWAACGGLAEHNTSVQDSVRGWRVAVAMWQERVTPPPRGGFCHAEARKASCTRLNGTEVSG